MSANRKDMSCQEFSACMAELIASGEDIAAHPHVRRCRLHRALLEDLEAIAAAAREMFPEVDPPDAVWDEIQARLDLPELCSIVSDPWPGWRVVSSIRINEHYNGHGSPPAPEGSGAGKPPIYLKSYGHRRTSARRERDDR